MPELLTVGMRQQAVAARGLQSAVPSDLDDEHDVASAAHELGDARMAQHVRRQLKARRGGDLAHDEIDGAGGPPAAAAADPQRRLAVGRDLLARVRPRSWRSKRTPKTSSAALLGSAS